MPTGLSNRYGPSSRGSRRGSDLPIRQLLIAGAVLAILLLLFVIGSTGENDAADADANRTDLTAIVKPALTRAGYGDVVVTSDGRTVTISGELATRTDVVAADAVVKSIAEVAFVVNNLSHPGQIDDDLPTPDADVDSVAPGGGGTTNATLLLQSRFSSAAARAPITFQTGGTDLTPESATTIQLIAELMAENPTTRIEIGGHTDSDGEPAANEALSLTRAEAVLSALLTAGVEADRMVAVGYGDAIPVASNETGEGKAKNRRIEFLLLV
jgi:outer membrane protein OmpA-like peptidoglycan-associated protein